MLVGATSQHFAGSLGREHILRELYKYSSVLWWEPLICTVYALVLFELFPFILVLSERTFVVGVACLRFFFLFYRFFFFFFCFFFLMLV